MILRSAEKKHSISNDVGFADRLKTAAEAKSGRLAKFEPKPTVTGVAHVDRRERKAAALEAVRKARAEERLTALATRAENEAARAAAAHEAEQIALEAKRQIRKSRKTSEKVDANLRRQSRRDALTAYGKSSTT